MTAKPKIRIGIVGAGGMGKAHSQAFIRASKVYSLPVEPVLEFIADVNADLARSAAEHYGFARWTTDWRELVNDPAIDVVDVATPNHLHAEPAIAAALAGKSVYCEKPLGETEESARRVLDAVRKAGVKSYIGFNNIKAPATLLAKRIIEQGEIGRVIRFRGTFDQGFYADPMLPYSWRLQRSKAGSGAIGDLGSHLLSVAQFLIGDIAEVCATTQVIYAERPIPDADVGYRNVIANGGKPAAMGAVDTDDQTQSLVTFANGVSGVVESSRVAAGRIGYLTWEISGTEGTIAFDGERMNELQYFKRDPAPENQGFRVIPAGPGIPQWHGFFDLGGGGLGYYDIKVIEAHDLITGLVDGAECFPDFEFGWKVSRVIDAMLRSSEERRWVKVEEIGAAPVAAARKSKKQSASSVVG
jgi:predicted dehydrogenase